MTSIPKAPPYKYDIEEAMIVSLLKNPELIKMLPLKTEHFYHKNNAIAYDTLKQLSDEHHEINMLTFGSKFSDNGGTISSIRLLFDAEPYFNESAVETYLHILAEELIKRKIFTKYHDLSEAPKEFIDEIKTIEMEFISSNPPKSLTELYDEYQINYLEKQKRKKESGSIGVVTGFKYIDENCPFDDGDLIILAAKTSVGKTALALTIGLNAAMFGQNVLFFSAEMTAQAIQDRLYAQLTYTAASKFKFAEADNALVNVKSEIQESGKHFKIIESGGLTSTEICRISIKEAIVFQPKLIVVDYIQYLKDPLGKNVTNNDRIGNITRNLHALAQELKCAVLGLSQVNRATSGIPELHNLRDSGNIEQDAETVLILHRESREDVVANLIIAKNRNGIVRTDGELKFDPKITKFY